MTSISTIPDLELQINNLKQELNETRQEIEQSIRLKEQDTTESLLRLNQQINESDITSDDDIISDMNNITSVNKLSKTDHAPQANAAGLSVFNKHFTDLTNHELHNMKKMTEESKEIHKSTIMDQTLDKIIDNCINFLTFSYENFTKKLYESQEIYKTYDNKSLINNFKVYFMAIILYIRDGENIIYLGIIFIFISILLYFFNIIINTNDKSNQFNQSDQK